MEEIKSHDWAIGYQIGWGNGIKTQKNEEIEFLEANKLNLDIWLIEKRLKELRE